MVHTGIFNILCDHFNYLSRVNRLLSWMLMVFKVLH